MSDCKDCRNREKKHYMLFINPDVEIETVRHEGYDEFRMLLKYHPEDLSVRDARILGGNLKALALNIIKDAKEYYNE